MHRISVGLSLGLVVSLAMAGLGLRLLLRVEADELPSPSTDAGDVFKASVVQTMLPSDPLLGWVLAPDLRLRTDGVVLNTNSRGLRADREYASLPPPGIRRIAAFGDAYTQCSEVSQDECWVPMLERMLPNAETLNFGVDGYGPEQAWLRYQRDGRPFHPCLVLIGHSHGDARTEATADLARVEQVLVGFAEQVASDGAIAAVVIFPDQRDLLVYKSGVHPYGVLVLRLAAARINTIDLTDYLRREAQIRGIDELYESRGYSAFGNRRVARYLATLLLTKVLGTCDR